MLVMLNEITHLEISNGGIKYAARSRYLKFCEEVQSRVIHL